MTMTYPAEGKVSIWIGSFETEDDFDACVEREVSAQLSHEVEISSICEVGFESGPKAVADLLDGFSGGSSFIASAVKAASLLGVDSANAALVCYHIEVRGAPPTWGQLLFLGSMDGTDVG